MMKIAPFKGPVEIAVRGSHLALGRDIANNVFVEIIAEQIKEEDGATVHG